MAWVKFDHRVKYNGQFYPAGKRFKADDMDLPMLRDAGAEEVEVRSGRPRNPSKDGEV